jgi:regulator of replication initiation timing
MPTKKEKTDNVKYEEQNLSMITKELRSQTKDLEKQIQAMQDNNLILWKLPDNLSEALKATTPDIASELQKRIFQSNIDKVQKANEAIDDMMQQFDKMICQHFSGQLFKHNIVFLHILLVINNR